MNILRQYMTEIHIRDIEYPALNKEDFEGLEALQGMSNDLSLRFSK